MEDKTLRKIILSLTTIAIISLSACLFHSTQSFYKAFAQGKRFFKESEYHKSLPFFISAFDMKPDHIEAAKYLLWNYEKLGMQKELKDTMEVMWKNNPDDPFVAEGLADSYYNLLDYKRAEEFYSKIPIQKRTFNIRRKLAEVLTWQKRYDDAIPILKELIEEEPKNFKLVELLADVYSWVKEYDNSIKLYKRLLDNDYRTKDIVLRLADVLRFSGRNEEAIELYNKYLKE